MARPVRVRGLTEQEGQKLQHIVRRGSTSSVRFRRAMMLLASAGGSTVPVIARLVQADEDTVRDVIHKFNEIGLACLDPRWAGGRPASSTVTTRILSSSRLPPARPCWASPSPAGRSASSPITCGATVPAPSSSAGRPCGAYSPAAGSPSSARRPGRSPRMRPSTPSWPGLSTRSTNDRTARSRSTSSGLWESAPPLAPAGPSRPGPTACRPPTGAPTASPTSTAATP